LLPVTVESKTTTPERSGGGDEEKSSRSVRPRWSGNKTALTVLTALFALVYSVFSCTMFYTARTATYDLGIFYQGVKSYSDFRPGYSIAKGLHNFGIANFSVLGDHFSPIDALLAPLIWIYNSPVDLLVAQAVLFALAIPPIWSFTNTALGGGRKGTIGAYCVAAAYGMSWPIAGAAAFNFHEVAWAPVLTAIIFERLQKGKFKTAIVAIFFLLMVKEDMGFFLAGIGAGLIVTRQLGIPRQRRTGLILVVVGIVYSVCAVYFFIPAMGGRSDYYWAYQSLGPNAPSAVKRILGSPVYALKQLITPRSKLHTELELLAPFLFLSLLSPYTWPAIPLILERFLASKFNNWWTNTFHYNAYLIVPMALGGVDGAIRASRWITWGWRSTTRPGTRARKAADWAADRMPAGICAAFLVTAIAFVPSFAFGQMFNSSFYHRNSTATAEAHAASLIPSGVVVVTPGNVGPFLLTRDTVLVYDNDGDTSPYQPWIIGNDGAQGEFGFTSQKLETEQFQALIARGYVIVWHDKATGFFVAHAPNVSYAHPKGTPILTGIPAGSAIPGSQAAASSGSD
jgi:uncharacterized membrane protein